MAKKATKPVSSPKTEKFKRELLYEIYGISLLALSIIAMASLGAIGRNLTYLARFFVGSYDFLIPLIGVGLGFFVMLKRRWPNDWSPRMTGLSLVLLSLLAFSHYFTFQILMAKGFQGSILDKTWDLLLAERDSRLPLDVGGGMLGAVVFALFYFLFESIGTVVALCALLLCGFLLVTGFSYVKFFHQFSNFWENKKKRWKIKLSTFVSSYHKKENQTNKRKHKTTSIGKITKEPIIDQQEEIKPTIFDFEEAPLKKVTVNETAEQLTLDVEKKPQKKKVVEKVTKEEENIEVPFEVETSNENYLLPPISILTEQKKTPIADKQDLNNNADKLVDTLESFGVSARVIHIHRGPAVTRYEIQPQVGVKVSRIVNLADDLALVLAAKDIRIEAPIPGKSAIGIEVPNLEVAMVGLRDIIESSEYADSNSKLTISLGRDISGDPQVAVLSKMPHLLVAGATGSGKSVCINGIIVSLLYKAKPDEVKLMMIDPKMVELNIYNGIPHLLAPVVTDPRRAAIALKKVVKEMEKRYELFANIGARDIERYNTLIAKEEGKQKLPYIVVIVDELADLMMVAPADVEDAICRLAQMARAAGIHLIIATQRPSVDVITGVIKANIPSRIAFAVSAQADSRTILDMGGAEKLLGRGDMLYLPVGASKPVRLQGTYLSDEEVEEVVSFVKQQQEAKYVQEMIPTAVEGNKIDNPEDELYLQAVQLVVEAKTASVSLLQRRLRIGYSRAARLIDSMEQNGIVGPYEGSKPREVRLSAEEWKQQNSNASTTDHVNESS